MCLEIYAKIEISNNPIGLLQQKSELRFGSHLPSHFQNRKIFLHLSVRHHFFFIYLFFYFLYTPPWFYCDNTCHVRCITDHDTSWLRLIPWNLRLSQRQVMWTMQSRKMTLASTCGNKNKWHKLGKQIRKNIFGGQFNLILTQNQGIVYLHDT